MKVNITQKELDLLPIYNPNGSEAVILDYNSDSLLKLYFNEEDYNPEIIDIMKERQKHINKTTFPFAGVYVDNKFAGILMRKVKNYVHYAVLNRVNNVEFIVNVLLDFIDILEELTNNWVYPLDINLFNVLLEKKVYISHLIDTDGEEVIYANSFNRKNYNQVLRLFRNMILETVFKCEIGVVPSDVEVEPKLNINDLEVHEIIFVIIIIYLSEIKEEKKELDKNIIPSSYAYLLNDCDLSLDMFRTSLSDINKDDVLKKILK